MATLHHRRSLSHQATMNTPPKPSPFAPSAVQNPSPPSPSAAAAATTTTTTTITTTTTTPPAANSSAGHHPHPRPQGSRRSLSASHSQSQMANGNNPDAAMPSAVPPPPGPKQAHGQPPGIPVGPGMQPFDASRSPPGSKNLNHVPCKFFRQGACQAGKACPFSHSTDPSSEAAPCKYFSKGNCKFGAKCALAHILPDGRRVNHRPNLHHSGHSNLQFGRMDTNFTNHRSALHNSIIQANMGHVPGHTPTQSLGGQEDFPALPTQPSPQIDQPVSSSLPDSQYGSPRNADAFGVSPMASSNRTLGPLDATLPSSIDRLDYSYFAKHGPFASSVPNKFGLESPPPSLPSSIRGESTVHALRRSAFGEEDSSSELSRSARGGEDSFGARIMHSSTLNSRSKMYPASYGPQSMFGTNKEADSSFAFGEEDFLPESLTDLLTPAERSRRMSRPTDDDGISGFRHSLTSPGTPSEHVFGSPPVGSPGSWGPIISRQKRDEEHTQISGVGHVGSPLRNSYLSSETSPPVRGFHRSTSSGDINHFPTSAPRPGVSALTQSLKRTSLSGDSQINGDHPTPKPFAPNGKLERAISSPRLGNGTAVHPIDEETETQFNLEVEPEEGTARHSAGLNAFPGSTRPTGLGLDVGERYT